MITPKFKAIMQAVRDKAEEKKLNAAYGGEMGDGGAGHLESVLEAWKAGLQGKVPRELKHIAKEVERKADPEYKEYERLTEKFEGE